MSQVDKQALREVAQNATQGEWDIDYPDDGFNSDDALIQREAVGMLPICVVEGAHPESGFDEGFKKEQQANASYIAAANPTTMLALLDENEALEKRVAELAEEIANLKAKALYWDADNTESSYEDPADIANDLDLNPGDHFYVQVAYLDKDREYVVNDDGSVSCAQLVDSSAAVAQKLWEAKA
ncbi:ead/Ea22-like family protein [Edwardsiella tarda]|uniref:ead/Ea22-like family protein n=1 Tax=Edwardsiella tarda TaxID=636 RepID=UPI0008FADA55|nr:ead/Ea22-like family protein [Edwardsiella tarda]